MAALTQDQVRQLYIEGGGPRKWSLFALLDVSGNDTADMTELGFFRRVNQAVVMNSTLAPGLLNPPNIIGNISIEMPPGLENDSAYMLVDGVPVRSEYLVAPRATSAPFEPVVVALAAGTTKTVLQVATPSTTDIRLIGWGVSFDGVSGTAIPVICQLIQTDTAATVTAYTPDLWGHDQAPVSLCARRDRADRL